VITSSTAGQRSYPNLGHYSAAKHGVIGLMRSTAVELGPHRIRVNAILPGGVNTPMLPNDETYRLFAPDVAEPSVEELGRRYCAMNALPIAWVEPIDISNAVTFLCSDEARYITGVALPVDAGTLVR
jgi:NAD(P)-dependent dehydrogenase (short-subunit alcohol dehydrogenase family)